MIEQVISKRYFDMEKLHKLCKEKWGAGNYDISVSYEIRSKEIYVNVVDSQ